MAGPTGVGKTQATIELALRFASVIVSADSRQIYQEMNIGTAKPDSEQLSRVRHHFIDHISLSEEYSAGRYSRECLRLLETLFQQHDIVFMTGGTGLYIRAVIEGFDDMPDVSSEIREKWMKRFAEHGLAFLHQELTILDPEYAAEVDMQNPHRLIRALSVIETAGKPFSALRRKEKSERPFEVIKIFCNLPRQQLYGRIHERVDQMLEKGLVDEVKSLVAFRDTQAMQTVGYKEIIAYFDGNCTLEEAIAKIKQHTCNYAKRQITWFKHQGDWQEFDPPDVEVIADFVSRERDL